MTIEAPTDGAIFVAYRAQVLCPKLRPGDVVLDNLSVHKVALPKVVLPKTVGN
jgi:hypothetical protein